MQAASNASCRVKDVGEIVSMKTEPKLAKLSQKGGARSLYGIIKLMLVNMSLKMHLADGLSEVNTDNIARNLTNNDELRWWLTLADVDLLCRRIAEGYYGKFYGHFSESEFNECLVKYCNERTELHRVESDKCAAPDGAVLEEIGYKVDEHGRLVVPEAMKGKGPKKPMRYLYDASGKIVGENPAYWGKARPEKSNEEMQRINEGNQMQELAHKIMYREGVGYMEALSMAKDELEKRKEATGMTADPNTEWND